MQAINPHFGRSHQPFQPFKSVSIKETLARPRRSPSSMTALPLVNAPEKQHIHCTPNFPRQKINKSMKVIEMSAPMQTAIQFRPCQTPTSLSRQPSIQALAESQVGPNLGQDDLDSFMEGVVPSQPDNEEYLRVWFENMALRQKMKKA